MILIVTKKPISAYGLSDMFYYMGLLNSIITPNENSGFENIATSVMVLDHGETDGIYVENLRERLNIPIFAISRHESYENKILFDKVINQSAFAPEIFESVKNYHKSRGLVFPGNYKAMEFNASLEEKLPKFLSISLPFTKAETMILRAVIRSHPHPISASEILKSAFKNSSLPQISNVRTHISVMNKKTKLLLDKEIISLAVGRGYKISN